MNTAYDIPDLAPSGRATTVASLRAVLQRMRTPESVQAGLGIRLRPTDVVVTPFGKSGTTWLQQICHTLRTRGDMDFDDISRVTPWLEVSAGLGIDINAEQKANPRVFKSHLDALHMPPGGRYINACRNPADALYSMYKFMEGWFLEPGTLTLDEYARGFFIAAGKIPDNPQGSYWQHLKSWWLRRDDPDVLFMAYEHMKNDLTGTIRKVAAFMEITLDDELLAITREHASLAFMQRHKDRFDDKLMREHSIAVAGMPADSDTAKVRSGQVGEARTQLGSEVVAELDELWHEQITREFGFENYQAMIATLAPN